MFCAMNAEDVVNNVAGRALDRRSFMKCALASSAALGGGAALILSGVAEPAAAMPSGAASEAGDDARFIVEAKFYQKLPNRKIKCKLCPRECTVGDKERGYCGVRENRGGTYYTLVHSRVCAAHVDPIEKKPLFHYLPGTTAFSIATAGCNVNCKFCQNWDISQSRPEAGSRRITFRRNALPKLAKQYDCPTIAYTYSEPVDLCRVSDGRRRCGARCRRAQHCGLERLYAGGCAEGGVWKDGRHQDRSEILHRVVLQQGRHRSTEAGAGFTGHAAQDGQVDGDRLPGAAYAQRQRYRSFAAWRNGSRQTWAWMCLCISRSFIPNTC